MKELIKELKWRGLLHQHTAGLENLECMPTGYVGFDPTADSLHIGNLAPIMLLIHLNLAGGKIIGLVGGATGMIGDPSGKKNERKFLDETTLDHNFDKIKKQLFTLIISGNAGRVVAVNNFDWYKNMSILDFLRNVGKHATVNTMMTRDSVRNRIKPEIEGESVDGISFTEFTYQLIQAKDFEHLNVKHECNLQMGGSDQWGNITAGIDLVRRTNGKSVHGLTCPLITKTDGTKFGKSEAGNVWLDKDKTSPFEFFQFWINQTDIDAKKFIKIFTLLDKKSIEVLIKLHDENPAKRFLQNELATNLTEFVHGKSGLKEAQIATDLLFGKLNLDTLSDISVEIFEKVFKTIPQTTVDVLTGNNVIDILSEQTNFEIFKSKGDVRRLIKNNGLSINLKKVNVDTIITDFKKLHSKFLLIQKGKKNFHVLKINN